MKCDIILKNVAKYYCKNSIILKGTRKMTNLLIKKYVKNHQDTSNPSVREKYGMLSGFVGIFCNVLLSVTKFIVGSLTGSISIFADAANNLSDASSSVVTLLGAKIANKPADKEHPFGHGRSEYIAALIVSFMILLMGFELGKSSITKIFSPEPIAFSWIGFVVILMAIPVKLWMAYFNNKLYKKTKSLSMKAVCKDSLSDCIATGATLVSLAVSSFTKFNIDGYIGAIVAVVIIIAGVNIIKEILAPLLGQAPDEKLVKNITSTILSHNYILGVHDLIIHDYGPNRVLASAHAEVPSNVDIIVLHDIIDNIEVEIQEKLNVMCVIHMDPLVVDNEKISLLKEQTRKIIDGIDSSISFHDFRVVEGATHTNVIFDVVIPFDYKPSPDETKEAIVEKFKELDEKYRLVINVEHSYTE